MKKCATTLLLVLVAITTPFNEQRVSAADGGTINLDKFAPLAAGWDIVYTIDDLITLSGIWLSPTSTSLLWGTAGELWDPRGRLPDYSYAGYHMGEVPLPTTSIIGATNIQSYGAIPNDGNDDSSAIQSAIDATSFGVIYFPAGEYVLETPIIIDKSNIVLVGDGDGTSASDTKLYCPYSAEELDGYDKSHQTGKIGHFIIFDSGGKDGSNSVGDLICTVIESAKRGDRTLRVDDASALSAGDYVLVVFKEPNDKSMWEHILNYHELPAHPDSKTSEKYLMQIERIVNDLVTFKQPFRFDVNTDWEPEIKTPLFIEEVGIENIRVQFIEVPHADHHDEPGYNAIRFGGVMHGWARNVTVKHSDNAFRVLSQSAFITLTDIAIKGRDGHHAFNIGHASHTLLSDITSTGSPAKWTHGVTYAHTATCNVTTNVTSDQVFDLDLHSDAPFENLFENIENWGYHSSGSSPGKDTWPHTGARTTYWNLSGTAGIPINDDGELWGHIQTNLITNTTMADILSTDDEWYEDMGTAPMTPASLYKSQLTKRLTAGPDPLIAGSGPTFGNRQNWFERDPARWRASELGGEICYQLYFGDYPNYGLLGEFSVYNNDYIGDIEITVDADSLEDFPANPDADYALILGYQDPYNYYYAHLSEITGNCNITKVVSGTAATLTTSATLALTDGFNNIIFRREGNDLKLLFDGTIEMTTTDTTFTNGKVGFGSFDDAVRFKNINIQ